ncbi:MAG: glycosyltransferase family 2 protein [Planctomycetota bacterium]|jgi:glycosyltransferase involved in cell wall biosynthesis
MRSLHVVIPFYNEERTLEPCVRRVVTAPLPEGWRLAIYLVDDHSGPAAARAAESLAGRLRDEGHRVQLLRHESNAGKGAALQSGFDEVLAGDAHDDDVAIIQDADLEYDPTDYCKLIEPIVNGEAEAVLGTRWGRHRSLRGFKHRLHAWANAGVTKLSNLMTGLKVGDMECCYKLMPVHLLRRVRPLLTERRFAIEPQIVAAWARLAVRVAEVPVSYHPRGPRAGKKITWRDAAGAVYVACRERFRPTVGETADRSSHTTRPAEDGG